MTRFAVIVEFAVTSDGFERLCSRTVQQARDSVRLERDCHQFDVTIDAKQNAVLLYEIYSNEAAFDNHLQSEHFKSFDNDVAALITCKTVKKFELLESAQ